MNRSSALGLTQRFTSAFVGLLLLAGVPATAAEDEKPKEPAEDKKESKIKPYDEVITSQARSQAGLLRVHQVDDKLFYELRQDTLDTDLLWVTQISETTAGNSYAGMPAGQRVVRWEKLGDRILLRDVRYNIRAGSESAIAPAVRKSNLAPIIRAFDIRAYGRDQAPVIEVTDLFTKEVAEFSAKRALDTANMDADRSFIERVKVFPHNINVAVLATYAPKKQGDDEPTSSGITAVLVHSMVRLPEHPMKPRRFDERLGFFTVGFTDYAIETDHQAEEVRYITRWRLEKKDPQATVSDPIQPIVFYVGREVPQQWKPFVKQGIEDWQPAFESAGFSNAIVGKYPPDPADDPDWDPEDARISSIRWLPSSTENAFGPHVHDPRSGEILEADIRMYHNVQKLVRDWYFIQASPNDERAQKLPMPDDLVGELIRFVVAHEVGHSLGFPHNMKASSAFTIEQLRDPDWTRTHGTAASIMDYARFNYVAQPGDGASLLPRIGPYDHYAVNWGYRQYDPDLDEKAELEKLLKQQVDNPIYRFGGPNPTVDSTQQTEDLGNHAIQATRLGLQNLHRIADNLVNATSREGKDYDLLDNMFTQLLNQWNREMGHVMNVVGGVQQINLFAGDANQRFFPNDPDYQREAVAFLLENALSTPTLFLDNNIILRLTAQGVAPRLLDAQMRILRGLVDPERLRRMTEHAEHSDSTPYSPADLLADLQHGVFSEFQSPPAHANLYRRNLQRSYVDHLAGFIREPAADSDLPALARAELQSLSDSIKETLATADSPTLRAHLNDLLARINKAFDED